MEKCNGTELTRSNKNEIKAALKKKDLPEDTPLKGCPAFHVKKFKGAGWKVLLHKEDYTMYIVFKRKKKG